MSQPFNLEEHFPLQVDMSNHCNWSLPTCLQSWPSRDSPKDSTGWEGHWGGSGAVPSPPRLSQQSPNPYLSPPTCGLLQPGLAQGHEEETHLLLLAGLLTGPCRDDHCGCHEELQQQEQDEVEINLQKKHVPQPHQSFPPESYHPPSAG